MGKNVGSMLKDIAERKGIRGIEVDRRMGKKEGSFLRSISSDMRVSSLIEICSALGVELCVIDGWKKETLGGKECSEGIDIFMAKMDKETGYGSSLEDRWEEPKKKEKREYDTDQLSYMKGYQAGRQAKEKVIKKRIEAEKHGGALCDSCRWRRKELRDELGMSYCKAYDEYTVEWKCKFYEKEEEAIPEEAFI